MKKRYCLPVVCISLIFCAIALWVTAARAQGTTNSWVRINQLGYTPGGVKQAVWVSKNAEAPTTFELVDSATLKVVYRGTTGANFGKYGPFQCAFRLDFSKVTRPGKYLLRVGKITSPVIVISRDIYRGTPDFVLRYMRQQRSGFNPFLRDSCHTQDGYVIYAPSAVPPHIDVAGGWHDASDYLQYATTSANATYHLLAAYRDFPSVFGDTHQANGLEGKNGLPDVLDEGRWGLNWLLKMHPQPSWMFNQIADDRDHQGFRLPTEDPVDYGYGPGNGRPVYFLSGKVQGLGKYKNRTTGTASTAGKFASAFALGARLYKNKDAHLAALLTEKALSAYRFGLAKPGVAQTAPNLAPYFYEEDNWTDDMELASAQLYALTRQRDYYDQALNYSLQEKVTPWMGADTARHYQWYPFHNFGHYELAMHAKTTFNKQTMIAYYKEGIDRVWGKAVKNGFYHGVPFIWCSNNLTVSFAIQCYLYRKLSGDASYAPLEQACVDWLFGCNPWGKCMIYGLPAGGDTPRNPHSALSHLYHYPLDGGLVDGPVYTTIFKSLKGVKIEKDDYAPFQSDLVVYHDDFGDYSTNEPTMDGTASLVYLLAAKAAENTVTRHQYKHYRRRH